MSRAPTLTPRQKQVLAYLRLHPASRTDDMAVAMGLTVRDLRSVLLNLHKRKLVGRQEPLLPHGIISTWTAEMED